MTAAEKRLIKSALWIYRQRNAVDAEFFKIDATCKCSWCRAKREFVAACLEYTGKAK